QALDDYLRIKGLKSGDYLFPGRRGPDGSMTTRQYARLVSEWVGGIGLDRLKFATHSMRRYSESRIIPSRLWIAVVTGVEPDLLGIILTPPKASPLPLGGQTTPHAGRPGCFRPDGKLLDFLNSL